MAQNQKAAAAESAARNAADHAADAASDTYGEIKKQAQSAIDSGRRRLHDVAEEGKAQLENVSSIVRDRPLLSLGVAFAAGCIVGRLLTR